MSHGRKQQERMLMRHCMYVSLVWMSVKIRKEEIKYI